MNPGYHKNLLYSWWRPQSGHGGLLYKALRQAGRVSGMLACQENLHICRANKYEHGAACTARCGNANTCSDAKARSAEQHVRALYMWWQSQSDHAGLLWHFQTFTDGTLRSEQLLPHPAAPPAALLMSLRKSRRPAAPHAVLQISSKLFCSPVIKFPRNFMTGNCRSDKNRLTVSFAADK